MSQANSLFHLNSHENLHPVCRNKHPAWESLFPFGLQHKLLRVFWPLPTARTALTSLWNLPQIHESLRAGGLIGLRDDMHFFGHFSLFALNSTSLIRSWIAGVLPLDWHIVLSCHNDSSLIKPKLMRRELQKKKKKKEKRNRTMHTQTQCKSGTQRLFLRVFLRMSLAELNSSG